MNVLFVIAEMAPLAKVGGVGDVGGSLPRALRRLGVDARVALPYYGVIRKQELSVERVASLPEGALWRTDAGEVPVYLIEHALLAGDEVYGRADRERFLCFCDTLAAGASSLGWRPDVLHLHDWHTGFLAMRLAAQPGHPWTALPRVCTVHNLGYPGAFDETFARKHGLDARTAPEVPAALARSALAQEILLADIVSTVSPTYAREILTPEYGEGLDPLLRGLGDRLVGVLNGIDVELYDPKGDPHLAARFDAERLDARADNKRALQERFGLPIDPDVPLVSMVNRLVVQKGADLAADAIDALLDREKFQFALLGTGDKQYERQMAQLAERHPLDVAVRLAFDPALAQLIYGGSDLFLMPSRYEPCGLGQMMAMRYGAIPVVRRTGGLADSVDPYDAAGRGTGFLFDEPTAEALAATLAEAFAAFRDRDAWRALQRRAMGRDFSWEHSASQYVQLYQRAADLRPTAQR